MMAPLSCSLVSMLGIMFLHCDLLRRPGTCSRHVSRPIAYVWFHFFVSGLVYPYMQAVPVRVPFLPHLPSPVSPFGFHQVSARFVKCCVDLPKYPPYAQCSSVTTRRSVNMLFSWKSAIHVLWKRDAAGFSPEKVKWHLSASDLRSENSLCSSLSCSAARLCFSVVVNPFTMGFTSHIGSGGWPFLLVSRWAPPLVELLCWSLLFVSHGLDANTCSSESMCRPKRLAIVRIRRPIGRL